MTTIYRCIFCGAEAVGSRRKVVAFPCRKGTGCTCKKCGANQPTESKLFVRIEK